MVYAYKRAARQYAEANLGSLLPLHEAIPELKALGGSKTPVAAEGVTAVGEKAGELPGAAAAETEAVERTHEDAKAGGHEPRSEWTLTWTAPEMGAEMSNENSCVGTGTYGSFFDV